MIVSAGTRTSLPSTPTCRPASSIRRYSTPLSMRARHGARARRGCTHPVVRPSVLPKGVVERFSMVIFRWLEEFPGETRPPGIFASSLIPQCDEEGLCIERRAAVLLEKVEGNVEADAAHADDRHLAPRLPRAAQDLDVARDFRMLDARNRRPARVDAGGDDHLVEAAQVGVARRVVQPHLGAGAAQALRVVGDRFGEFLLAGNLLRQIELAAELARRARTASPRGRARGAPRRRESPPARRRSRRYAFCS